MAISTPKFIKPGAVSQAVHAKGHRLNRGFLYALDEYVWHIIDRACREHNGGRVTLDRELFAVLFPPKN